MDPWTPDRLANAIERGCHKSARDYQGILEQKFADMMDKGYFTVLPFPVVKDLPNLWLSPVGVIPVEYMFVVRIVTDASSNTIEYGGIFLLLEIQQVLNR
jgi:hypothetical protein